IAGGCYMLLFFNNLEEYFEFMLNGYRKGVITEERLHDALLRILGLKAKLTLHIKQAEGNILKSADELAIIGCDEHLA
ncbi:glycosyl hydrolase, partial [Streptococcus suis]